MSGAGDQDVDEMVVSSRRMTDNQIAAHDRWHSQAMWAVDLAILADVGAAGCFGWADAGAAVGNEVPSDSKDQLIDQITDG